MAGIATAAAALTAAPFVLAPTRAADVTPTRPAAPEPAGSAAAQVEISRPLPSPVSEAIAAATTEEMASLGIPGLALAMGDGGQLRFVAGFGLADVENDVPAGPETVFRLASLSKPVTAAAALRLVEAGRLDLDAPVWTLCEAFPQKPWPLTARQLLCHQGGVRHYRAGEQPQLRHCPSLTSALSLFKDDPLVFEPGTSVLYSTYAYDVLGCAIEGAAGRSFTEVLRQEIFAPAVMTRTQPDDSRKLVAHRAGGYVRAEEGELLNSAWSDVSCKLAGGGLSGTAPDVARFGLALLSGKLLGRRTLREMLTPQKTRAGRVTGFGLGLTLTTHGRQREAWHTGGQEQVSGVVYLRPDSGLVVVLLSNLEGVGTPLLQLARRLADLVSADHVLR
jgi:serine beta-lactamase-like protein LACTB